MPSRRLRSPLRCALTLAVSAWSSLAAADRCDDPAGRLVSLEGDVSIAGRPARMDEEICSGESIGVGARSRAAVRLADTQTVIRIDQNSTFLIRPSEGGRSWLELLKGAIYLFSRQPESLEVQTPYLNAMIRGTEFVIAASTESSEVTVIEGSVRVGNALGETLLAAGETSSAEAGRSPGRGVLVDPSNAVQWALHYPSIGDSEETSTAVRRAAALLTHGDVERAEALLREAPEDASALALRATIAVTRNRLAEATRLAERAVDADAGSSSAYTALSYTQQARFEIEQALASANIAVRNDPLNADALARQAELRLGVDDTSGALGSAREATAVASDNSRARTVLGFVHLIRLEIDEAEAAFAEAVVRDPGDPLPRLGLGLATIRGGRLVAGREHLELAAALDPNDALVRSYLGKAYAEERELDDAAAQFALAQILDPQDPTPWLYQALLDQGLNRPADAFRNIERARALNDNRLVYQSRLLVDKSEAAGSLSLARIYTDLGFEQPAINESTRSIEIDPTDFSAYRFLADSYAQRGRHEAARRSVLFQAALLQPLTIDPVQPYPQESDLLILPGTDPVDPSIREYSPLFEREGFQLAGSLVAGEDGTVGDDLVLSGLHDRVAYSLGQFHYATDGFRRNADIEHTVHHGFVQGQIRPGLFAQAAFRRQETEQGDLSINVDPENYNTGLRRRKETTSPHIGLRAELGPRSTLLLATRTIDRSEQESQSSPSQALDVVQEVEGQEAFARLIHRGVGVSHSIGVDAHELDVRTVRDSEPCVFGSCPSDSGEQGSAYASYYYHATVRAGKKLYWTLGLSYALFDDEERLIDERVIGPRLGVRWRPARSHDLRLALSRGMKRREVADLVLEPTALAGFNQLHDDFTGTRYANAGIAYDRRIDSVTRAGAELVHRELELPVKDVVPGADEGLEERSRDLPQRETTLRGYWSRILRPELSLGMELLYERFERDDARDATGFPLVPFPLGVETLSLPISLRYTHRSGFFTQGELGLVHQSVERIEPSDAAPPSAWEADEVSERFTNLNLSVGMRLPTRRVTFRLDVTNLLDETFLFQGHNIRSAEPSSRRFSPGRAVVGRVSFSFR